MTKPEDASAKAIRRRAERMQQTRNEPKYSPLNGLGVFGVIGWSVAMPTVAGAFFRYVAQPCRTAKFFLAYCVDSRWCGGRSDGGLELD